MACHGYMRRKEGIGWKRRGWGGIYGNALIDYAGLYFGDADDAVGRFDFSVIVSCKRFLKSSKTFCALCGHLSGGDNMRCHMLWYDCVERLAITPIHEKIGTDYGEGIANRSKTNQV